MGGWLAVLGLVAKQILLHASIGFSANILMALVGVATPSANQSSFYQSFIFNEVYIHPCYIVHGTVQRLLWCQKGPSLPIWIYQRRITQMLWAVQISESVPDTIKFCQISFRQTIVELCTIIPVVISHTIKGASSKPRLLRTIECIQDCILLRN